MDNSTAVYHIYWVMLYVVFIMFSVYNYNYLLLEKKKKKKKKNFSSFPRVQLDHHGAGYTFDSPRVQLDLDVVRGLEPSEAWFWFRARESERQSEAEARGLTGLQRRGFGMLEVVHLAGNSFRAVADKLYSGG